jgi:PAS domain S-box-containing protein
MAKKPSYGELEKRLKRTEKKLDDHQRTVEALRECEEAFRATFEQAAMGIAHASLEGKYLRVNQRLCEFLGYTLEEILDLSFQEITHPDDLEEDVELVRKLLAGEIESFTMEKRYLCKDGSTMWCNLTVSLGCDPSGRTKYLIGVMEDISERKRAEEALRESEEELRKYRDHLEELVSQRTTELIQTNKQLAEKIDQCKHAEKTLQKKEKELKAQSHHLEEVNAALRVLLKQREEDKRELEDNVLLNVKEMVLPYVEKLNKGRLDADQLALLSILKSNVENIISPFINKLSSQFLNLTPREIRVAGLTKEGRTNKEMAELLSLSENTILFHRHNIRSKLGLKKQKINLRSYLSSFDI